MKPTLPPQPQQPQPAQPRQVPDTARSLAELQALVAATNAATARGGNPPEIAQVLNAASEGGSPLQRHGWTLHAPSFGTLQVLDEIRSPLLVGGEVKMGDIAAALCVLEDPQGCWHVLSVGGMEAFNDRVWLRTKDLAPKVATELSQEAFRLIRQACGLEEGQEGNGEAPAAATVAPVAQARTPDGSLAQSSGLPSNTDGASAMPSGGSRQESPASSLTPARNDREESPADPVPVTAPDSRQCGGEGAGIEFQGAHFESLAELEAFVQRKIDAGQPG